MTANSEHPTNPLRVEVSFARRRPRGGIRYPALHLLGDLIVFGFAAALIWANTAFVVVAAVALTVIELCLASWRAQREDHR
jgi:hypothetical protein